MIKNQFIKKCFVCKRNFTFWRCQKKARFCSHKCGSIFKIGKPNTSKTKFFKGQMAWNKGKKWAKKSIEKMRKSHLGKCIGNKNGMWKGDKAGYDALHDWVKRRKKIPEKCSCCKKIKKRIEWANKDHSYKRILKDYIALCTSCHRKHDIKYNNYIIYASKYPKLKL